LRKNRFKKINFKNLIKEEQKKRRGKGSVKLKEVLKIYKIIWRRIKIISLMILRKSPMRISTNLVEILDNITAVRVSL